MQVVTVMGVQISPRRIPMSREQFLQLPEGPPFYDYVNGEAIEVNRPSVKHQYLLIRLASRLMEYVESRQQGWLSATAISNFRTAISTRPTSSTSARRT
jgi:Uma2 family endonuclease